MTYRIGPGEDCDYPVANGPGTVYRVRPERL
jgi:hypothetical protein